MKINERWLARETDFAAEQDAPTRQEYSEHDLLAAGERERQQVGRDLHDGLGQYLHAVYYMAALLHKRLRMESSASASHAQQLVKQMEEALDVTRRVARGLQPVGSMPDSLMHALAELAEGTSSVYRVDCRFEAPSPVFIECRNTANHLFRIAQEAVNNAVKHGRPTRIRIKLMETAEALVLSVWDNGTGIKHQHKKGTGLGLPSMEHRAKIICGSLIVERGRRGGTNVFCTARRPCASTIDDATFTVGASR